MDEKECKQGMRFILISGHMTILVMFPIWYWVYNHLSPIANMDTIVARWQLALKCNLIALLPFILGIQAIANHRAFKAANNPLLGLESERQRIHIRYTQNTLEQFLIFFVVTMTSVIYLDTGERMRLLPIATGSFVFFRILFWAGYLKHWSYRAPGMVGTGFSYIPLLFYTLYWVITEALP